MSIELSISILGIFIALGSIIIGVAGLTDEGRERLSRWTKTAQAKTSQFFFRLFILVSIFNGIAGIIIFGIDPRPLARSDVLLLVLFIFNFCSGVYAVTQGMDRITKEKNQTEKQ